MTEAPRYGEKTKSRVTAVLKKYDALQEALQSVLEDDAEQDTLATRVRTELQQKANKSREEELAAQRRAQEEAAVAEAARLQELERQQREQDAAARERQAAEEDLARRARESRVARQAAVEQEEQEREEQARRDAEWERSIPRGVEGVRAQLEILGSEKEAVNALHTLFSQIVAHPEQPNFRRVRRDHPQFHQDIGRHKGGREVLIAAGFRLGAIDGVSCFISTEPNIEKDMDGWSQWFDLLKATLECIEQEMIK